MSGCSVNKHRLDRSWGILEGPLYEWSHFYDESVLFNPLSGQTHLLTIFVADILEFLLHSSANSRVLVEHMAALYQVEPEVGFQQQVLDSLDDLHNLGLIESMGDRESH